VSIAKSIDSDLILERKQWRLHRRRRGHCFYPHCICGRRRTRRRIKKKKTRLIPRVLPIPILE
jgi:hypothetical protein